MVAAAMKLNDCFLAGNQWQKQRKCVEKQNITCQQKSGWSRLWSFQESLMTVRADP